MANFTASNTDTRLCVPGIKLGISYVLTLEPHSQLQMYNFLKTDFAFLDHTQLCSGITPGGVQGTICGARNQMSTVCKESTLILVLSPAPNIQIVIGPHC